MQRYLEFTVFASYDEIRNPAPFDLALQKLCCILCFTDINECQLDANPCPPNSKCVNNRGSYSCECLRGYQEVNDDSSGLICEGTLGWQR